MGRQPQRVYCAGPLFNAKEREEMAQVAKALEDAGYATFLPQRDGLELMPCVAALVARGFDERQAVAMLSRAIFALDIYQVVEDCDAIVVNLNGRVPDEGAVSEAAIAWCSGKALVGYKADGRSLFLGQDNPLVAGLFDFSVCDTIEGVISAMTKQLTGRASRAKRTARRRQQLNSCLSLGKRISGALRSPDRIESVTRVLAEEKPRIDQVSPLAHK
ncbi:MAG: nucleoside 2-deoxyribosyltransferase [Candidatus Atribacteria bacterium]|nr:nucleoside 2-deoxyribosyltransferase [Candidatus Atribacteria bacterium]MBE3123453.1 nucleoside 2-deoxyribosyltransferase [Planctomycetota bacterium]